MLNKFISKKRTETFVIFTFFDRWHMKVRPFRRTKHRLKKLEEQNAYLMQRMQNLPYELKDPAFLENVRLPKIASVEETITVLAQNNTYSIARFGDGEFGLMFCERPIGFQKYCPLLRDRLLEVMRCDIDGLMVAFPSIFGSIRFFENDENRLFGWTKIVSETRPFLYKNISLDKQYYNAAITRTLEKNVYERFKKIFAGKKLVIVEGELTRFGVGNDLLSTAGEVKRILCPAKNAFDKYNEILNACKNIETDENTLFLVALGPTATVLAYDLHKLGRRAFDIGHLDICYEWKCHNAADKIKIAGKYVNEVKGGDIVEDCVDKDYLLQITAKIL